MDDIENDAANTISLFDRIYDQALAQVEAVVSCGNSIIRTPSSRRNSYLFENDDATYFSSPITSSTLSGSSMNTDNRTSFSRPSIPLSWLNLQPREKGAAESSNETPNDSSSNTKRNDCSNSESSGSNNVYNIKRKSRRLKRPPTNSGSSSSSNPSTPKDENVPSSNVTNTVSMDVGNNHEYPRAPLERTRSSGGLQSNSRRGSLCDGSALLLHSRQNSSTSMGFYGNDSPRDSGYYSSADKRRSQSSMARRGSKDLTAAYHMRQSSYGRSSPDSDDAESVTSVISERRASIAHHTHPRSETPTEGNVYDRLSKSQTHSSSAKKTQTKKVKNYNGERRSSVTKSHSKQGSGGVSDALAALEGRREDHVKSPDPVKVQA